MLNTHMHTLMKNDETLGCFTPMINSMAVDDISSYAVDVALPE